MSEQQKLGLPETGPVGSVEGYEFEPIKGYPMLQWKGKRPFRSTQFFPAQLREVHGPEMAGWRSKVYWGDNLQVMSHLLKGFRGQIRLVYVDPPYDSHADYKLQIRVKGKQIAGDQVAFEEKQYNDIWTNDEYLQFMYDRIVLMRELLDPSGVLCLQCDSNRGHYLKCILDEVFGPTSAVNTINWQRSHAHGDTGQGAKHFGKVTEYIHVYARNADYLFTPQYAPYSQEIIDRDYKYVDEITGELYRLMPVDGPGGAAKGNPYYEFLGVEGYFRYSRETMQKLYDKGEIVLSSTGKTLSRKRRLKDAKGTPVTDLWSDVNRVSPTSSERLGYPTQKPEVLLERIIRTFSAPGDIVFDCFMGSGTTQAVAMKLGRRFIGADINLGAVQITTRRLIQVAKELGEKAATDKAQPGLGLSVEAADEVDEEEGETASTAAEPTVFYTGFEVYNVNYYDIFRNPVEAKELLMAALEVQPLAAGSVYDGTKDGRMVKVMPVNRIATRADLNDLIANFDYKTFERRYAEHPTQPVEKVMLVCMGHELDLAAALKKEVHPKVLDVEVFDVLRDGQHLQFKRDAEARVRVKDGWLVVEAFYPMNLLGKLSLQKESVEDWRELADSVMVDWNYDGAVLMPAVVDIPEKNGLVVGRYRVPEDAGTIRVKITDLLSESWEGEA